MNLTKEHIDSIIAGSTFRVSTVDNKTTIVIATLPNGFQIVESSSCVDPDNYDVDIGRENAMKRIVDKVWELEGYVAQGNKHRIDRITEIDQRITEINTMLQSDDVPEFRAEKLRQELDELRLEEESITEMN